MNITPIYTPNQPVITAEQLCRDSSSESLSFEGLMLLVGNWQNNNEKGSLREQMIGKFIYLLIPMQPFMSVGDCRFYAPFINGEELKYNPIPYISWCCFSTPLTSRPQSYKFC